MAHHQLFEWEARGFEGDRAIPAAEAEMLARAAAAPARRLKGAQRAFELGRDSLTAQNLVGIVAVGGTSCEILPKIDRHAAGDAASLRRQLIRMLAVAYDLPIADDAATTTESQNHTLLEVLITRFAALLHEAVRRGIPRFYVARDDDLPALRGRLDVARQFTALAAGPQLLACRYDEFSEDIALNQAMKAAVVRLRALARSPANQRALADLSLVYTDVAAVPPASLRWDGIVADRTNSRWQGLLRLARLILGDRFQNSTHGTAEGFSLLFDMNALFERYVERLIAPIASRHASRVVAQGGGRSCLHPEDGGAPLFATYPDMQIMRGQQVVAVVDTKWKRLVDPTADRKMGVAQADLYQMMAYAQLYDCRSLILLYPHHAGLVGAMPRNHRVVRGDGDVRLTVATVDLADHAAASAGLASLFGLPDAA